MYVVSTTLSRAAEHYATFPDLTERTHSRVQQPCKFIGTKESVDIM